MHFNYRYFETDGGVWWFGGGTDITPAYLDEVSLFMPFLAMLCRAMDCHGFVWCPSLLRQDCVFPWYVIAAVHSYVVGHSIRRVQ